MTLPIPTKEQIEDYLSGLEEFVSSSLSSVTPDIPKISETVHRLWLDVSRFGPPELPSLPDIHIPGLGSIQVPPPSPPPPPPPSSWFDDTANWARRNKVLLGAVGFSALGVGVYLGYSSFNLAQSRKRVGRKGPDISRKRVVVVLGGDSPLGLPLISALETEEFVVITSVSSSDAVDLIHRNCNGYVKALVLDPKGPETVPYFIRSLEASLSLRFPINVPGDPYNSTVVTDIYIHSVISLLTLPTSSPVPSPFENTHLTNAYLPYLIETHIVPLLTIQQLLPVIRTRCAEEGTRRRSIVICVPVVDARVGVPFSSVRAMSAAATVRGAEVLRRELQLSDPGTDSTGGLKVVIMDVGAIGSPRTSEQHSLDAMTKSVAAWSPSERAVYGKAYGSTIQQILNAFKTRRTTPMRRFVKGIITVVGGSERNRTFAVGLRLWSASVWEWTRGYRLSVGTGAGTYTIASYLPTFVLDPILRIPAALLSWRSKPGLDQSNTRGERRGETKAVSETEIDRNGRLALSDTQMGARDEDPRDSEKSVEESWISLRDHD